MTSTIKQVYTNKELRETLESLNIKNELVDSFKVELTLFSYSTYEHDVKLVDLEYKGYSFKINGYMPEEDSQPVFDENFESLNSFLELIGDKEINSLDNEVNPWGSCGYWEPLHTLTGDTLSEYYPLNEHLKPVEWIDETPEEIKDEFEKKFRDNNYRDIYDEATKEDEDKIEYGVGESLFINDYNNISRIYLYIKTEVKMYEIQWLNNKK
mgnify:FL=1